MASRQTLNEDSVFKSAIEGLLHVFQVCEDKDSQYLKEKGNVQVSDVYFVLINALRSADFSVLPDTIIAVGQFLHNVSWIGSLTEKQCGDIVIELCNIIEKTNEKSICSRAIWCFYSQNLCTQILSKHIKTILLVFSKTIHENRFTSSSVEFEVTRATKTFLSTNPQDVLVLSEIWWKDCLLRTIHPAPRIREMALSIIMEHRLLLGQNSHVMQIIPFEVKTTIVPGMLKLFSENGELYVLKLWQAIVNLCGKIIHQGSSLINYLLVVVEKAFKYPSDEIRLACFACWRELISNFAIAPDVIGNVKRLRLILQPLCGKNAKSENTVRAKIDTWWHLLSCLGQNNNSFEMVFEPLIQFCFGLSDPVGSLGFGGSRKSRSGTDTLNASTVTYCGTVNDVFAANKFLLIEFGTEMLGRFFEACSTSSAVKLPRALTLGPLHHNMLLKSSVLVNHSKVLLHAIEIATCTLSPEKDSCSLLPYIWLNVANHLKSLVDIPDNKPNLHDAVSNFYQTVEAVVQCEGVDSKIVLLILEYAASLPFSVLMSTSYNLGQNNKQNATPGFQLLGLLLSKNVVEKFGYNNKFTTLLNRLTTFSSMSPNNVLNSFHVSIQIISKAVPDIQKEDLICKMWLSLVSRLVEFVEESQEVNQGDSLEHDFSCMHAILIFPFQHFIWKVAVKRNVLKKWESLYQVFARCAGVVSGVDANACCIELASKLKGAIPKKLQIEGIEDMIYVVDALLSSLHWSGLRKNTAKGRENKWMRKKAAEIFELAPITQLIGGVISSFIRAASNLEPASKSHCVSIASTLVGYFDMIFEKLKNGNIIHAISQFSTQLVEIVRLSCNSDSIFADPSVFNKIEGIWEKITKNLLLNYNGPYDTSLLNMLSPLLEATFSHKKRSIQMDTRLFWQGTFASSYDPHLIPDSLRQVIEKVKPTIGMDNSSLDDKTIMSSSESKIGAAQCGSVIVGSGFSSPNVSGSYLNKVNKSPSSVKKLFTSPAVKSTPKSKGIEEMNAKEFVVIKSPNKGKKRVLTEHQKEVASRRSLIPAMYVDLSQDSCIAPAETHDVEDSQQVMDKSYKEASEEVLKSCTSNLNKENCAGKTQNGKETCAGMRIEALDNDANLKVIYDSTSKNPGMPSIEAHSEIGKDMKVNTCVANESDEANIELLYSPQFVINDKMALQPASNATENADVSSISCDPDSPHDNQDSLATYAKNGSNPAISDTSKGRQAGFLQILNIKEENSLRETDNSIVNPLSCTKSRRSSLRNSNGKEKVYFQHKRHQLKKRNVAKTKDPLSCDFVDETCEFKDISLDVESQNANTNITNQCVMETVKNSVDNNVTSKEADRENCSKNSDDLLNEMGFHSLSSVYVECEVMVSKEMLSTNTSQTANTETPSKTGVQQQDSITIISSSSSLEASEGVDVSSTELCCTRSEKQIPTSLPLQRKRKSMRACTGEPVCSPVGKSRKSDKLTEEEVLLNIRARKRKSPSNSSLGCSPPMTRTRKKQKQNNSESSESVGAASHTDTPSCFRSDAQPPQESLTMLTVENNTCSSLPNMTESQENSDTQDELQSLIPAAVGNSNPEEDRIESLVSTNQHDPSSKRTKASGDNLPANGVTIGSSAKSPRSNSKTLPVAIISEPRRSPRKAKAIVLEKGSLLASQDPQDDDAEVICPAQDINLPSSDKISYDSIKTTPTGGPSPFEQSNMNGEEVLRNPSMSCKVSSNITRHGSDHSSGIMTRSSRTLNPMLASPSSSPGGIMKKAGANSKTSTPTTPNKRKVSFADPPVQGESPRTPTSGKRSMFRIVNRRLQMTKGCSQDSPSGQHSMDMTQDTYHSPMITDLNCHDCVCPELVSSKEPIDILIPHLTSSLYGRGLSKLLSSRNISTIGDLSALTEADVYTLPIKAPKLPVVRRALLKFSEQTKVVRNGGHLPLPCQSNTGFVSAVKDSRKMIIPAESSPAIYAASTPEKDRVTNASLAKECSPMKRLEDEIADDSLYENDAEDALRRTNLQLSTSEKFKNAFQATISAESSPGIHVTSTPVKDTGTDASRAQECSPMKNLEDEMADDSLYENNPEDVLSRTDLQLSTSDKCESTIMPVDDAAATTSNAVNNNPFQDIYDFLGTRFEQISPSHLSQVSGNQIRELIAHLGTFSTRVSEAWLDSKCMADTSHNSN